MSVENDEKRRRLMDNDDEKHATLVVESCVVTFAIHCGEHRRYGWRKGGTVERKTKWKEASTPCLHCGKKFAVFVVDGDDGDRGTRSICDIMIGMTRRGVAPMIRSMGDLLCSPTLEWRTIAPIL